jgi:hypothetical protein
MKKALGFGLAGATLLLAACGVELGYPGGTSGSGSTGGTTGSGKYIFVTSNDFDGGDVNGVGGADSACNSDPNRPNTNVTYNALIATGTVGGGTQRSLTNGWPLKANTQYIRPDRVIIGKTDGNKILSSMSSSVGTDGSGVWTGLNSDWSANASANCNNWSTNASTAQGQIGLANNKGNAAISSQLNSCSIRRRLYCVEL